MVDNGQKRTSCSVKNSSPSSSSSTPSSKLSEDPLPKGIVRSSWLNASEGMQSALASKVRPRSAVAFSSGVNEKSVLLLDRSAQATTGYDQVDREEWKSNKRKRKRKRRKRRYLIRK